MEKKPPAAAGNSNHNYPLQESLYSFARQNASCIVILSMPFN